MASTTTGEEGWADIYFSRSVGKDTPAAATLLVVCGECMPIERICQYAREQFPVRRILNLEPCTTSYNIGTVVAKFDCTRTDKGGKIRSFIRVHSRRYPSLMLILEHVDE